LDKLFTSHYLFPLKKFIKIEIYTIKHSITDFGAGEHLAWIILKHEKIQRNLMTGMKLRCFVFFTWVRSCDIVESLKTNNMKAITQCLDYAQLHFNAILIYLFSTTPDNYPMMLE
jgi:hypothetical protein